MWDDDYDTYEDYGTDPLNQQHGCPHTDTCNEGGKTVCRTCGFILDTNNLSLEVTFNSSGSHSVAVGKFIPSSGRRSWAVTGVNSESREATKLKARMELMGVASGLSLQPYQVECAVRVYERCLDHRCVQGRRSSTVLSACLYIVCRQQKKPQMLIDFSEYYQESVWGIAHTYMHICRALGLEIPPTDPTLYIERFVERLQVGPRSTSRRLAETALKIMSRMQRDWIHCGRRPAGIVAAALTVACRIHGYPRKCEDIVRLVRLHEETLRKRLSEMRITSCGSLTLQQLDTIQTKYEGALVPVSEGDKPALPPCFRRIIQMERMKAITDAPAPVRIEENPVPLIEDAPPAKRQKKGQSKAKPKPKPKPKGKPKSTKSRKLTPAQILAAMEEEQDNDAENATSCVESRTLQAQGTLLREGGDVDDDDDNLFRLPGCPVLTITAGPTTEEIDHIAEGQNGGDAPPAVVNEDNAAPSLDDNGKEGTQEDTNGTSKSDIVQLFEEEEDDEWEQADFEEPTKDVVDAAEDLLGLQELKELENLSSTVAEEEARLEEQVNTEEVFKSLDTAAVVGLDEVYDEVLQEHVEEEKDEGPPETLSDISDDDLMQYLVTDPVELSQRRQLWNDLHLEFLTQQEERRAKKQKDMEERDRHGRRRGAKKKDENEIDMNDTAATATLKALRKRSSNNLNYSVLEELLGETVTDFDNEGEAPADDDREERAPSEVDYGDMMAGEDPLDDFLAGRGL